jgi:large subunit ribosomal protein L31
LKIALERGLHEKVKAMKDNIHPDYHEITVTMTDGTSYKTRSTYGKAGDSLQLDIDPKTHPAWTGVSKMSERGGQLAKFNKRFQGITAAGAKAKEASAAAEEAPKAGIKLTTGPAKKTAKAK